MQGYSAELSHSLKVSDRRRNTPKSDQNRSGSLCTGLWVPCQIFLAWIDPAVGQNPIRNPTFPARVLKIGRGPFSSAEVSVGAQSVPRQPLPPGAVPAAAPGDRFLCSALGDNRDHHLQDPSPTNTFNVGRFGVGFRSVLGQVSAKVGPGTVTNGPGLKNAA